MAGTGLGVGEDIASQTLALAPLADSAAVSSKVAIAGQTTRQMNGLDTGSAADVDGAWEAGKLNILLVWEIRNSIWGNAESPARTWQEAVQDMADYIAARRAANSWHSIILFTALPSSGSTDQANSIEAANAYVRANYRLIGADLIVDVQRDGSPFKFSGDIPLNFQLTQSLWSESSTWTHPSAEGQAVVAQYVSSTLRRISA